MPSKKDECDCDCNGQCRGCSDGKMPNSLFVTPANFVDRTLNSSTSAPGRIISPLSVVNRVHQLDRVFFGKILEYYPSWPVGDPEACGAFYVSAECEFGDLFLSGSGTVIAAEDDYDNEDNWARDLVYKLVISLTKDAAVPGYLKGISDISGGSTTIGGSVLPPATIEYLPTMWGDPAQGSHIANSMMCSSPAALSMTLPQLFVRNLRVYKPGSPSDWWFAHTSEQFGTYHPSYAFTDGDAHGSGGAEPNEQTAATVELIASAGRS